MSQEEEEPPGKWKHKELSRRIKWTGPTLPSPPSDLPPEQRWTKAPNPSPQSPLQGILGLAPTDTEIEEHQRDWNDASDKYVDEQLRKLPLLAQHYGFDASNDAWIGIAGRNDLWLLNLVLVLAQELAKEALGAFEATKAKEPNRFQAQAGAAMAADKLGDKAAARRNYQQLVALTANADTQRPEVAAAKKYLASN